MKTHHQCKQIALVLVFLFRFIINDDNSISEEITHRTEKGNRAFYAYQGLMTSRLISKYTNGRLRDNDKAGSGHCM